MLTGNELTASKAFVAISLFNILRFPLVMLPGVIISLIQVSDELIYYYFGVVHSCQTGLLDLSSTEFFTWAVYFSYGLY